MVACKSQLLSIKKYASKSHNDIPNALSIVDKYIQIAINKLCFAKVS